MAEATPTPDPIESKTSAGAASGAAESGTETPPGAGSAPDAEAALDAATEAAQRLQSAAEQPLLDLPDFTPAGSGQPAADLGLLNDVNLNVKIELGRTTMYLQDVLKLNENSVVELDKAAGDPVDVYVNDRHIARGEVLVLDDNFCVRISEILHSLGGSETEPGKDQTSR